MSSQGELNNFTWPNELLAESEITSIKLDKLEISDLSEKVQAIDIDESTGSQVPSQSNDVPQQQQPVMDVLEKRKLIAQRLKLIFHADGCMNDTCTQEHCRMIKDVLNHLATCNLGKACPRVHCSSTMQIINHWKNCNRSDCPVCSKCKQFENENRQHFVNLRSGASQCRCTINFQK